MSEHSEQSQQILENNRQLEKEVAALRQEVASLHEELERLRTANERLSFAAEHDGLTGIFTRQAAIALIENAMTTSQGPFILAFVDVDNFKCFNDTYGHQAGDEILVSLSSFLQETAEGHGVVGRFGGDEFLFFLDLEEELRKDPDLVIPPLEGDISNPSSALFRFTDGIRAQALEKLSLTRLNAGGDLCDERCKTSISLGVTVAYAASSVDELIRIADEALYQSKGKGKNAITIVEVE